MYVIIDNGHGSNTAGKCSPDKRLLEYKYARVVAKAVCERLKAAGIGCELLVTEDTDIALGTRCQRANAICKKHGGAGKCLLVSIHVNAAGSDGKWHAAGGWCAYTTRGVTKADALADCLYDAANIHLITYAAQMEAGKAVGAYGSNQRAIRTDYTDGDRDCEAGFYILKHTACPAVLTENLFQDNKADVDYLLSSNGLQTIIELHVEGITNYIKKQK